MSKLDQVLDEIRSGRPYWVFLDYDGTLHEFAPTPEEITPDPELIALLERLARAHDRLRIVILSGRPLEQVRQLAPVRGILVAGTYGIEYLDFQGRLVNLRDPGPLRPALDELLPGWQSLIDGKPGFFLEDKGWSLALHAKGASRREARTVLDEARELAQSAIAQGPYRLVGDDRFLEISPITAEKAHAVTTLLGLFPSANAGILYIGDDARDEGAFPVVQARGGVAVCVCPPGRRTQAQARLASVADVRAWLGKLAEVVGQGVDSDRNV